MKHVKIETGSDGIATITLDHATEPVNLVSPEWIDEFTEAVNQVVANEAVKGVIVTSAKPTFMAGADLKFILQSASRFTPKQAFDFSQKATGMHRRLETSGKPFVAALNGSALGGGFELALACHYRVLVDDPKATVGLPEVNVGLLAGSGGTQRVVRMVGVEKAIPLVVEGKTLAPQEALSLGLVDKVVPAGELIAAARAILQGNPDPVRAWDKKGWTRPDALGLLHPPIAGAMINAVAAASSKTYHNYPAPIANLTVLFEGIMTSFDRALVVESRFFAKLFTDPSSRNIIRTTFVNKGLAEKLERRPAGYPKFKVTKVGIIGAGMMGAGIAYVAALAGIEVVLLDSTIEFAEKGKAYSAKVLGKEVERGRRTAAQAEAILARIKPGTDYAPLADCQLVVEAVFEDTKIKAGVTQAAEAILPANAIFASNTSTLPISGLAEASSRPDKFIGLHFFSPVDRMALVEVIVGRKTSQETIAYALDFVAQLRKTPIIVNDSRGFYTSRVFQTFIHEGMAMLQEGIEPARIENAGKQIGMPVGPLSVTDEVSIELPWKIINQAEAELGSAFKRPVSYNVMRVMLEEQKRYGRKGGAGFYDYPEGGKKHLWKGLSEIFPVAAEQPDIEELKKRLLYVQAVETARCFDEGVLTHPADGDLGSVYGWGFPTYTGGTLSLIDTIGAKNFVAECDRLAQRYGERFVPPANLRRMAESGESFHAA